jgi:hypothetical protein
METVEKNELVLLVEQSGLEKTKGQILLDKFTNYFEIAAEWEAKINTLNVVDVSQKSEMKMAGEARKFLKQKRTDVEKTRKELKEQSLREGQTIDSIARVLKNLIEPLEEKAEKIEKFAEIKEAEEKAKRTEERFEKLLSYNVAVSPNMVEDMTDEVFNTYLAGVVREKEEAEELKKKEVAERIAKEKVEAEERERTRLENEKLKAEAVERDKALAAEKAKAKAEQERTDKLMEEQRKQAAKLKAEQDAKLKKEREAREKIEAELKAKQAAEAKAKKDQEEKIEAERLAKIAAEKKAAKAPKKEKLKTWIEGIELSKPAGMDQDESVIEIMQKFESFKKLAKEKIDSI